MNAFTKDIFQILDYLFDYFQKMKNSNPNHIEKNCSEESDSSLLDENLIDSQSDTSYEITEEDRRIESSDIADDGVGVSAHKRVNFAYFVFYFETFICSDICIILSVRDLMFYTVCFACYLFIYIC